MHLRLIALFACSLGLLTAALHASSRSSASYSVIADSIDNGGRRTTSASYTNDGTIGGIVGIANVTTVKETVKTGYVGQLYEITGLLLSATPSTSVNEGASVQLNAAQLLDDATTIVVSPSSVTWNVLSGPVNSIGANGVATAGTVSQDTPASVQGVLAGSSGTLSLMVLNVAGNSGSYANDGIDDAWQIQYFGPPPNVNAGPTVDFDGTGQTNLFKFIAGLNPLDPNSRFTVQIAPVAGQPSQVNVSFGPIVSGRTYVVTATSNLPAGGFTPLTNSTPPVDVGTVRTITDLSAAGIAKFYRVEITKP